MDGMGTGCRRGDKAKRTLAVRAAGRQINAWARSKPLFYIGWDALRVGINGVVTFQPRTFYPLCPFHRL